MLGITWTRGHVCRSAGQLRNGGGGRNACLTGPSSLHKPARVTVPLGERAPNADLVGLPEQNVDMADPKKRLIVVGDRVLIQPEEGEDRTKVGLYLPATAVDSQAVQGGAVLATGPGNALSAPTEVDEEPWKTGAPEPRYVPLQARIGDYAIFFRRAAVEITFEGDRYLVVPQAAILTLVREEDEQDDDLVLL